MAALDSNATTRTSASRGREALGIRRSGRPRRTRAPPLTRKAPPQLPFPGCQCSDETIIEKYSSSNEDSYKEYEKANQTQHGRKRRMAK